MVYQTVTAEQVRQTYGVPEGYRVDAVLAAGVWDRRAHLQHRPHLVRALTDLGLGAVATGDGPEALRPIDIPQLGHASEFVVDGRRIWFVPVMGTAVMSIYLHAACLFGAQRLLLVGDAGGLSPDLHHADIIVPTVSRGNDSAWMYQRERPVDCRPDPDLAAALTERLQAVEAGVAVVRGPTTTCECILAETAQDVRDWSQAGYLGVEMEAALTFAIGRHFAVPAAAVLHVSDNLVADVGYFDPRYADSAAARDRARQLEYDVALGCLLDPV